MKKLKHILIAALLLAGAGACTANFDEYNTNPNEMDLWKIAPAGMIQELLYSGTEVFLYRTWQLNGELIQYTIAGSGNNTYHRYVVENSVGASAWSNLYKQAANADHMRQLAIRKEDPNYEAIALTLRTLFLQNIADLFGDVPCSEAFKGPSENVKQPVFDTQEQVYRSLLADLERANSLYDNSVALSSATRDLLYKGDLTKWRKFNNSLYLRLLMRLSNRNAAVGVAAKIAELEGEEKLMFLEELGVEESGLDRLIKCSYALLGLISFLTYGKDECRAWTIKKGTKAPQAAGKIHSDIERGFIRAEVIAYEDMIACGSVNAAKEKGLLRSEGKEYVVQDGDMVYFRFNV